MAEQLTSVRLDTEDLERLRVIASAYGSSVAAEIRFAVARHVQARINSEDFRRQVQKQTAKRDELIQQMLAGSDE